MKENGIMKKDEEDCEERKKNIEFNGIIIYDASHVYIRFFDCLSMMNLFLDFVTKYALCIATVA